MQPDEPEIRRALSVQAVYRHSDRVVSVQLADPAGAPLPAWSPGAHAEVELPNGLIRQYSLCGRADDTSSWRIAVQLEPQGRGGSRFIHEQLRPGDVVEIRRLRNQFPLQPADRYLFIAGGIGITAILPMAAYCRARAIPHTLYYLGTRAEAMAFVDELPERDTNRIVTSSTQGRLDVDAVLREASQGTAVYCCGPPGLLDATRAGAEKYGLPMFFERFGTRESLPQAGTASDATAFEVSLERSGRVLAVPADLSILEVLERNDIPVEFSCREGTCGTCETKVLGGRPAHRDSVLDDDERESGDTMMICVSRSATERLELDL